MSLKSKIKLILNNNDVFEGDRFICKRTSSSPVSRQYLYKDGKIKTLNGNDIKPVTAKNLINYYNIIKCD